MKMVALLRGINVGGNGRVPMTELCALAATAGFTEVASYINSGNLVFDSDQVSAEKAEIKLESLIEKKFGFPVDVIVRSDRQWKTYIGKNPFPSAGAKHLMIGFSEKQIGERTGSHEQSKVVGGLIWIDFADGFHKTKLTPAWLDKSAGSSVTLRNWNTLLKIQEMLSS